MQTYRIVVGYDGSDGGVRALEWTVAEACVRRATCPVVVVPAPRTAAQPAEPDGPVSTAVY